MSTETHLPTYDEVRASLQAELPRLRAQFKVGTLGIFGSYVRGEQTPESDLDLLVTYTKTPTLFRLIELELELTELLGIKVDLVPRNSLKPVIGERILKEVIDI